MVLHRVSGAPADRRKAVFNRIRDQPPVVLAITALQELSQCLFVGITKGANVVKTG